MTKINSSKLIIHEMHAVKTIDWSKSISRLVGIMLLELGACLTVGISWKLIGAKLLITVLYTGGMILIDPRQDRYKSRLSDNISNKK